MTTLPADTSNKPLLIFGSQSKFRRGIFNDYLKDAVEKDFTVIFMSADIDEKAIRDPNPQEMVKKIARGKREEIIRQLGGVETLQKRPFPTFIFTTDQVAVTKEGVVREKPEDLEEAKAFLRSYSNSYISTFTGYLMWSSVVNEEHSFVEPTKTHFVEYDDKVIEGWLEKGDCQKACGGFAVGHMMEHVREIEGGKLAVEGMTPEVFMRLLKSFFESKE